MPCGLDTFHVCVQFGLVMVCVSYFHVLKVKAIVLCARPQRAVCAVQTESNGSRGEVCEVSERYLWPSLTDRLFQHEMGSECPLLVLALVFTWEDRIYWKAGDLYVAEKAISAV